jgi:hypothetical protein
MNQSSRKENRSNYIPYTLWQVILSFDKTRAEENFVRPTILLLFMYSLPRERFGRIGTHAPNYDTTNIPPTSGLQTRPLFQTKRNGLEMNKSLATDPRRARNQE